MSWLKIDDQIASHPKIVKAGPAAAWLWICSIAYAQNHRTDGFIHAAVVGHLGVLEHTAKALVKALVDTSLWEAVDGGYIVHDYLKHNASKAQIHRLLRDKARAGRIGGQVSQANRRAGVTPDQYAKQRTKHRGKQNGKHGDKHRAKAPLFPTPLHSDLVQPPTAAARSTTTVEADTTAGAPDGRPSATASAPVEPPTMEEAQALYDRDPREYDRKYGRQH